MYQKIEKDSEVLFQKEKEMIKFHLHKWHYDAPWLRTCIKDNCCEHQYFEYHPDCAGWWNCDCDKYNEYLHMKKSWDETKIRAREKCLCHEVKK